VALTLTFRSLPILESQFSKTWWCNAILWGKGDSGLLYSGIDEIPVIHLTETEKSQKVNLIRQSHLKNLQAAEIFFYNHVYKPLTMVLCFSCDGVPLKFKKKNGQASSLPAQII
jgi:hypothetical protein